MRRQSAHFAGYRAALEKWQAMGLIYPAFESRARNRPPGGAARSRGAMAARSRRRAALSRRGEIVVAGGARAADRVGCALRAAARHGGGTRARRRDLTWQSRARAPPARPASVTARPEAWGDVILARKETPTSYHLSVVIDDALQGVTDVVRGAGPVLVDQRAPVVAGAARLAATGLPPPPARSSTTPGKSSRNRARPRPCANCAAAAPRRPTSAARRFGLP